MSIEHRDRHIVNERVEMANTQRLSQLKAEMETLCLRMLKLKKKPGNFVRLAEMIYNDQIPSYYGKDLETTVSYVKDLKALGAPLDKVQQAIREGMGDATRRHEEQVFRDRSRHPFADIFDGFNYSGFKR